MWGGHWGGIPDRGWDSRIGSRQGGVLVMGWDTRHRQHSRQGMMSSRQGWGNNINESPKWNSSLLDFSISGLRWINYYFIG